MINCEQDLLTHLIVLTPRNARKEFRKHIFRDWNWRCAYCDKKLNEITANIDHIVPIGTRLIILAIAGRDLLK